MFVIGKDKKKCFLLDTKGRLNKVSGLDTGYDEIHTKQYLTVPYLGCLLHEFISGESTALTVTNKINSNRFLSLPVWRLLCNSLIQPHFDVSV